MINKLFIHLVCGAVIFILGATLHDYMGFKALGNLIAYSGIAYTSVMSFIIFFKYKPLSLINNILDDRLVTSLKILPHKRIDIIKRKLLLFLVLFFIPMLLHALIFGVSITLDPCNNNSGCMAGSASAFFFFLFTIPTILILFVFTLFQVWRNENKNYKKYFSINIGISISSFFIAIVIYFSSLAVKELL